jgi:hypothetical protein
VVGVVVVVAAVGEEMEEAVEETVGEAVFGVAVAGMVAGKVLLLVGGGSLVKALRGAEGQRHRWRGPTRRGGWHTPHCHVWSWLCPASSKRGLDRWGAITNTGAGTSVMIAVGRVFFCRHRFLWGLLGGEIARPRLGPPL